MFGFAKATDDMDEADVITAHNLVAGVLCKANSRAHLTKYVPNAVIKVINLIDKKTFKLLMS